MKTTASYLLLLTAAAFFLLLAGFEAQEKQPSQMEAPTENLYPGTSLAAKYFEQAIAYESKGQRDSAILYYGQAVAIYFKLSAEEADSAHWARLIECYNGLGENCRRTKDLGAARANLDKALKIGQDQFKEQHLKVAETYRFMGNIAYTSNQVEEALSYNEKALEILEALSPADHLEVVKVLHNIGVFNYQSGNFRQGVETRMRELALLLKIYPDTPDRRVCRCYNELGNNHWQLANFEVAMDFFIKAAKCGQQNNDLGLIFQNNIAFSYIRLGYYDEALSYFQELLPLAKEARHNRLLGFIHYNLGEVYVKLGEFGLAEENFQKSLRLRQAEFGYYHEETAHSLNNLGNLKYDIKAYEEALDYHNKALEIRDSILEEDHPDLALSHHTLGFIHSELGHFPEAFAHFGQAIRIHEDKGQRANLAVDLSGLADAFLTQGDDEKAMQYYKKSLEIKEEIFPKGHPSIATSLYQIGKAYHKRKDLQKGHEFYQQAINCLARNWEGTAIDQNPPIHSVPDRWLLLRFLSVQARALVDQYFESRNPDHLKQAYSKYLFAGELVDSIQSGFRTEQSKLFYSAESKSLWELAIEVSLVTI